MTQEALAQPEQEPVVWVSEDVCEGQYIDGRPRKIWWECEKGVGTAFYTTPPQPEQEPVAWMFQHDETGRMNYVSNDGVHNPTIFLEMNPRYALVCALYSHPPQRTEQEPVAWRAPKWSNLHGKYGYRDFDDPVTDINGKPSPYNEPLYTHPQRTWVGLTKKEVHDLYDADYVVFHQRIEAKLKEKNT